MMMRHTILFLLAALLTLGCSGTQTSDDNVAAGGGEPPAGEGGGDMAAHDHGEHHGKHHGEHHGEHHGPIHQHFQDAESFAARFDAPERNAWQKPEEVVAAMGIEPGMTVADIGAGTGYFLPHLSHAVGPEGRVLALDIEPSMVAYMQERIAREGLTNVEVRQVEFDNPGLEPGSVDRVLTVNTWHHIPGRAAYAQHVLDGLTDGGRFFIVDYTLEAESGPPKNIRLAPDAVLSELTDVMTGAVVAETLPRQYIVSLGRE